MAPARAATCRGGAILTFDPEELPEVVKLLERRIPAHARHRPDPATWVICNPHATVARWLLGEFSELVVVEAEGYAGALAALAGARVA